LPTRKPIMPKKKTKKKRQHTSELKTQKSLKTKKSKSQTNVKPEASKSEMARRADKAPESPPAVTPLARTRATFRFTPEAIPLDCMLVSSHPQVVRDAIQKWAQRIDADPDGFLRAEVVAQFEMVAERAADYLELPEGAHPSAWIRQTESTTVGLAELYNSLRVRPGEEFLTSVHDFFSTREILEFLARRTGVSARKIELFEETATATQDEIVASLEREIKPYTRVLALTWVLSSTGLKLPVKAISQLVARINETRSAGDRLIFCLDGVHGFGVEDFAFEDLGCDFFIAGCHKWLMGPRGTAIICGRPESWRYVGGTVPSLNPLRFPGGVLPYEYHFALADAFTLHMDLGKDVVEKHTVGLARRLKDGLASVPGVTVVTPRKRSLSSGIVCCGLADQKPGDVVDRLRHEHNIRASVSSKDSNRQKHIRFSPSILNTESDIDRTLEAMETFST
ncbi:MAG: aminotransferase class V-fold PLP-dependent enzyme, partial [Acidobacteriota bacterium]